MVARCPRPQGDRGTSLPEVLVTVILLGVIGIISFTAMVSGQRAATATTTGVEATAEEREAQQAVTRSLRTATRTSVAPTSPTFSSSPFVAAQERKVSFYAYDVLGSGPTLTTYEAFADGRLVETRVAATAVPAGTGTAGYYTWTATPRTRVLLRGVPATGPLFRYFDVTDGCPVGCLLATSGSPAGVTAGDQPVIDAVEVSLTAVRNASGRRSAVSLVSRVGVRRNTIPLKAP